MRRRCEPSIEAQLVGSREVEAGVIEVPIRPVELDAIETLADAAVDAFAEDRAEHIQATDVQPAFAEARRRKVPLLLSVGSASRSLEVPRGGSIGGCRRYLR